MKCSLLLLVFARLAQPTTVAQTLMAPDSTPLQGRALISLSAPCSSGGVYFSTAITTVNFQSGSFTVNLTPNDVCVTPSGNSTFYNVHWLTCVAGQPGASPTNPCPKGGNQFDQKWRVASSGSPVTVDSVIYSGDTSTWTYRDTMVRNEAPAYQGNAIWNLSHTPTLAGATCWRNGLHQDPGNDYTLSGLVLTSAYWVPGDDQIRCDYQILRY